jgi:hypothetical protein
VCRVLYCDALDVFAGTEGRRVLFADLYTPPTGSRDLYLRAAFSLSQLLTATAIVWGFRAYCGDKGLISEPCS